MNLYLKAQDSINHICYDKLDLQVLALSNQDRIRCLRNEELNKDLIISFNKEINYLQETNTVCISTIDSLYLQNQYLSQDLFISNEYNKKIKKHRKILFITSLLGILLILI